MKNTMNDNDFFNLASDNAKLNVDRGYALLSNAIIAAKNKYIEFQNLARSVKTDELELEYDQKTDELTQKIYRFSQKNSDYSKQQIESFHHKFRGKNKKIIKEIEVATERLRKAKESIDISNQLNAFDAPNLNLSLSTNSFWADGSNPSKLASSAANIIELQILKVTENIEKLKPLKSQWAKDIADLKELESKHLTKSPNRYRSKSRNSLFKSIMNS